MRKAMRQSWPRMPIFLSTLLIFFCAAASRWCVPSTSSSFRGKAASPSQTWRACTHIQPEIPNSRGLAWLSSTFQHGFACTCSSLRSSPRGLPNTYSTLLPFAPEAQRPSWPPQHWGRHDMLEACAEACMEPQNASHQVVQHARLRLKLAVDLAPQAAQPLHVLPQLVQLIVLLPDQATAMTSPQWPCFLTCGPRHGASCSAACQHAPGPSRKSCCTATFMAVHAPLGTCLALLIAYIASQPPGSETI